jgi:adenylate cyclase class 2
MPTEIEAKLKVDALEVVEHRLSDQGASVVSQTIQTDYYFDTADGAFTRSDRALRLRVERDDGNERCVVTYKGPREVDDFKKRPEINLHVGSAEAAQSLLTALGYRRSLAFNKRRHLWRLGPCEVALDELPLIGSFVEIEGPNSADIARVRGRLDLCDRPHVMDSYASLIAERLSQLGRLRKEVFL